MKQNTHHAESSVYSHKKYQTVMCYVAVPSRKLMIIVTPAALF